MPVLEDLRNAINSYPNDKVDVSITDFSVLPGGGTVLNPGDKAKFKVKVANTGELDMLNATVRVLGTNFADVCLTEAGTYVSGVSSGAIKITAGGDNKTGFIFLQAKAVTNGGPQDIVKAKLEGWNASLDHILTDHSNDGPAEGKLNKTVSPT